MSITACYSMNIYCDQTPDPDWHDAKWHTDSTIGTGMGEYIGESWASCARQARAHGWLIGRDKQRAVCPRCRND